MKISGSVHETDVNSLGIILIHARFQRKTNQNCISFDFDNDLFTFDIISVINTTSSELKHGTRLLYR